MKAVSTGEVDYDTQAEADILTGIYQLVFLSPETPLGNDRWHNMLVSPVYQQLVGLLIDEGEE